MINIDSLSKTFYLTRKLSLDALKEVSFEVADGEFVSIMGPSGSGKSTLMSILGCLDVPTGGSYRLGGEEVSKMRSRQLANTRNRTIGFVFQSFNLLPMLSAWENVALPTLYSKKKIKRKQKAIEILEQVGLGTHVRHRPTQMSGGQRQRVAIARALVNDPDLILADEPTGNLDWDTGIEILEIFKQLNRQGKTIIVVTHEEEIGRMGHRILRLHDGRLVADERLRERDV
ncbi:MAG: ABC transporter ATP-binding protein [bacterium]